MDDSSTTKPLPPPPLGYIVTGRAAHCRVARLFQNLLEEEELCNDHGHPSSSLLNDPHQCWIDRSPHAKNQPASSTLLNPSKNNDDDAESSPNPPTIAFLWENAPRHETKFIRDTVRCYSHLPHGIILDDKWALARLFGQQQRKQSIPAGGSGGAGGGTSGAPDGGDDHDAMTNQNLAILESHCFRGADFATFAKRMGMLSLDEDDSAVASPSQPANNCQDAATTAAPSKSNYQWEDLLVTPSTSSLASDSSSVPSPPPSPSNLWVVKDAMSNGAGGIWIVDESNACDFLNDDDSPSSSKSQPAIQSSFTTTPSTTSTTSSSILHPTHRYIAQRYAWPPTLYGGRKCHVRVYGLITGDGRAFVHRRAFLHVANELFQHDHVDGGSVVEEEDGSSVSAEENGDGEKRKRDKFEASVHITNCCANSHDAHKFAGEICVDLETPGPFSNRNHDADDGTAQNNDNDSILPLGDYLPSIAASMTALAQRSSPFVRGGQANCGFEYLGLDFVLSSAATKDGHARTPVAYLLEVNSPPSQDTATGLSHAEEVHDEVIGDLLRMWVLPNLGVRGAATPLPSGWRCVYAPPMTKDNDGSNTNNLIVPSKAAILNRIRWAMFERRSLKEEELLWRSRDDDDDVYKSDDAKQQVVSPIKGNDNGGLDTQEHKKEKDDECESRRKGELQGSFDPDAFVAFARSQFPYFAEPSSSSETITSEQCATNSNPIFFESGGGAQVPKIVSDAVVTSMSHRDRSIVGVAHQREARAALSSLLINNGAPPSEENQQQHQDKNNNSMSNSNNNNNHVLIMGSNASSLLNQLAQKICASCLISKGDEIVIASENHLANVTPWLELAKVVGATVKWWTVADTTNDTAMKNDEAKRHPPPPITESCILSKLITKKTKIVAVSHASNILGMERDIPFICNLVHRITKNKGQVVVDGVAAAPHLLASGLTGGGGEGGGGAAAAADWYVVSLHKLFGPHLGCLVGRRSCMVQLYHHPKDTTTATATTCFKEEEKEDAALVLSEETLCKSWEMGTMNYEACCGAIALKKYFDMLANYGVESLGVVVGNRRGEEGDDGHQTSYQITSESSNDHTGATTIIASDDDASTSYDVNIARMCIQQVESRLLHHLLGYLQNKCAPLVRIVQDVGKMKIAHVDHHSDDDVIQQLPPLVKKKEERKLQRIPIVCFAHANIPSRTIVQHCRKHGVVCRACKFLSTDRLWEELGCVSMDDDDGGVVRFSLAHYNTLEEIDECVRILEMLVGWYGHE